MPPPISIQLSDLKESVIELGKIRNVPQFLFIGEIRPYRVIELREILDKFKADHPDVKEIDFIISSPGGTGDDAYRIIRTLRKGFDTVNIIIPYWAKSAATLIALGGSKIIMDEFGELGPLDAQIGKAREDGPNYDTESALNDEHSLSRIETRFKKMFEDMFVTIYEHEKIMIPKHELSEQLLDNLAKFYVPLLSKIDPYKLGEKRRMLEIGEKYAERILTEFGKPHDEAKLKKFVSYLVNDCPHHGYVIDFDLVSQYLGNVFMPEEVFRYDYKIQLSNLSKLLILFPDQPDHTAFVEIPVEKLTAKPTIVNKGVTAQRTSNNSKNGKFKKSTTKQQP